MRGCFEGTSVCNRCGCCFLCEKKTSKLGGSKLQTRGTVLETCRQGDQTYFKMITTSTGHYGISLETLKKGRRRSYN